MMSLILLASCDAENDGRSPYVTHVRVVTAEMAADLVRASGTGEIKARVESDLSFKVSGKVVSRTVGVGDHVKAGQILATLDPAEQRADIESARASVAAQEATLRMASSVLSRRKALTQTGALSQQELDSAQQEYQSAQNDLEAARARLETANEALVQTELRTDADGTITARNVEVGQVVQPSTAVFTVAHDGARDAVFNVQESALSGTSTPLSMEVTLLSRQDVKAAARIREISPTLDRSLGTVSVKLAIDNPPAQMTLGSAIVADVVMDRTDRISLPWQSMFSKAGKPAVWVVDPKTSTVILRPIEIERYDATMVVLRSGVVPGEQVVVDGGQFLRDQQKVSISEEATQ
ncbi:efflux RND transporter periplasmic adaptor subunit [Rhizobium sp. FY34]|uniref:efflux RND transporter periplasmic adaptor subunit n=1 Tax=Rhizobium sp. FY34 TaxID=2562309 RepID=UPI001484D261|nr:efflux RND transporter periplasmic adaptor subunit [Rhizobium sp. FY34]